MALERGMAHARLPILYGNTLQTIVDTTVCVHGILWPWNLHFFAVETGCFNSNLLCFCSSAAVDTVLRKLEKMTRFITWAPATRFSGTQCFPRVVYTLDGNERTDFFWCVGNMAYNCVGKLTSFKTSRAQDYPSLSGQLLSIQSLPGMLSPIRAAHWSNMCAHAWICGWGHFQFKEYT